MSRPTLCDRYGPWALVTGAARGLGAEFARQLAAERLSVVLVDADATGLARTARELTDSFGVAVQEHALDLQTRLRSAPWSQLSSRRTSACW